MPKEDSRHGALIIGGGFFGLRIALYLREVIGVRNIVIIEKEKELMSRASYVNQARVHNGYHYPRSILTGSRSAASFPRFVEEYKPAIVSDFDKYYAIASKLSKVNSQQFVSFSRKIGADIEHANKSIKNHFSEYLIEDVFRVKEYAFDSHVLRKLLLDRIATYDDIHIRTEEEVLLIEKGKLDLLMVKTSDSIYTTEKVFNCSYAQLNHLHRQSDLPLLGLKHEIAEMCLVELPPDLSNFSVTVMDGPFFSIMPFPSRGLHTLSHVRYTPHMSWIDNESTPMRRHDTHRYLDSYSLETSYKKMKADVVRYIPALKDMKLRDSISDVKTVLVKSENDDSRPILFKSDFGLKGYNCIMGGKLDNIYDVFVELDNVYGK